MNLKSIIGLGTKIGISGHVRPDGDCIGSTLALYHYIKDNYKDVDVTLFLEEAPEVFLFLPGISEICHEYNPALHFDVFFALDCGDEERMGDFTPYFQNATHKICIDHHKSNPCYGDENHVIGGASSTCELIYDLIGRENLTYDIAQCLYVGLVHDTGIFQYNSTTSHTMEIAGVLMDMGIPFSKIVDDTYNKKTFVQNRILGKAVLEAKLYLNGAIIVSVITKEDMKDFGATAADLDGIVNQLRITTGVEVAIFLYELKDGFKASLRGNGNVDLSLIAGKYNGGGHFMAAGLSSDMPLKQLIDSLVSDIAEQL